MRKLINSVVYMALFAIAFNFFSCQEESEEVDNNDQETLEAGSYTAILIEKTSTKDGSFDNIVDGASCFALQFPYTVEVNGIEVIIDSEEDLQTVEDIFDEVDIDEDTLEIIFPITVIYADFSELLIENKEQLRELASSCVEEGRDDDIECIDFVYPIALFTFDTNNQQTGQISIESDQQLKRFFNELEDGILFGVQYPVTLAKFDDTQIIVDNNSELTQVLEAAEDECDEDDDNDYNDDDFDEERFDFYLTQCPWKITEVVRDYENNTDQYFEYLVLFSEDGRVTVKDVVGDIFNGTWSSLFTDRGPLLTLEFTTLIDFNLEWLVYEIGEQTIKLDAQGGNKIIMRQFCDGDTQGLDNLREILKECEWIIKKVKNQGEEIDRLIGFEFKFLPNGAVTLNDGKTTFTGDWEIGLNSEKVTSLFISISDEPGVSFEWPLRELTDNRLRFYVEAIGYEMVVLRVCDDNNADGGVVEIRSTMMGGSWKVSSYKENDVDMTSGFEGLDFNFNEMHRVKVSENNDPIIEGLWRVIRNHNNELKLYLNFVNDVKFEMLTDDWYINSASASQIELVYEDENSVKILVFEKL